MTAIQQFIEKALAGGWRPEVQEYRIIGFYERHFEYQLQSMAAGRRSATRFMLYDTVLLDREIKFDPIPSQLEKWIAAAITNRPEILEFEERLAQSDLNIRVAGNTLLPQVDLVGSYSRAQTSSTIGKAFELRGEEWSAGVVISLPLGNVAARAGLAKAEIEHLRLQEQFLQQQRLVELEVRSAEITLRNSLSRIDALTKILDHSKELYEVAKARFALGVATNLDITNAQEDILDAETDLLQAIVNYNTGLADLEAAIARPLTAMNDQEYGR